MKKKILLFVALCSAVVGIKNVDAAKARLVADDTVCQTDQVNYTKTCTPQLIVEDGELTTDTFEVSYVMSNGVIEMANFQPDSSWTATSAGENAYTFKFIDTKLPAGTYNLGTFTFTIDPNATEDCSIVFNLKGEKAEKKSCHVETDKDGNNKYFDANGNEIDFETYKKECGTGSALPIVGVCAGLLLVGAAVLVVKKSNKLYRI